MDRKLIRKTIVILLLLACAAGLMSCGYIDYGRDVRLLCKYPVFQEGPDADFVYQYDCPEYAELLNGYGLAEIAGDGRDFERAARLMRVFHDKIPHSNSFKVEENSLAILAYTDGNGNGVNCRYQSKALSEMCLALGIPARRVGLIPYSSYDNDSHVVVEVYDKDLAKWVMMDFTNNAYYIRNDGTPLGVLEIRDALISGASYRIDYNGEARDPQNLGDYPGYIAKDIFYIALYSSNGFGVSGKVYFLEPKGADIRERMIAYNVKASGSVAEIYKNSLDETNIRYRYAHFAAENEYPLTSVSAYKKAPTL